MKGNGEPKSMGKKPMPDRKKPSEKNPAPKSKKPDKYTSMLSMTMGNNAGPTKKK